MSYVGVDLGTQSIKVVVYDPKQKKIINKASRKLDLNKTNVRGRAE